MVKKILIVYPNTMMATLLPVGISSLAAVLKQAGHDVELFDTTFYQTENLSFEKKKEWLLQVKPFEFTAPFKGDAEQMYQDFKSMVNDYKPDIIGVSVVEDTIPQALLLLEEIKDYDPWVPRVCGGVGATFNRERLLVSGLVNVVCIGEGEKAFLDFVNSPAKLFYSNTMHSPDLVDINQLPAPDFSIFEEDRIKRVMYGKPYRMLHIELDRGCPYACTYCCSPALKNIYGDNAYYRRKSVEKIRQELKSLVKDYQPDYIDFNSETFLARNLDEIRQLMTYYRKEIDIPFWCQSRPEIVTEDKIFLLRSGGVADMQFGIEHGNEAFRKKWLNRKATNEHILHGLGIVEKYKIPYTVNNIIGFPDETRELVFDTIEINRLINPKTMNVYMMTPYRGTWMRQYCEDEGLLNDNDNTMQLLDGADIKYRYLSKKQFMGLQRCFPLYVKMPERKGEIEKAEKFDKEGNAIFEKLRTEYIERFYR